MDLTISSVMEAEAGATFGLLGHLSSTASDSSPSYGGQTCTILDPSLVGSISLEAYTLQVCVITPYSWPALWDLTKHSRISKRCETSTWLDLLRHS